MWRQGQTHHPYTLSFLGTWGHGDTSLGYIDVETGTDTPPYTLSFLGTWGHRDTSQGYIDVETGTNTPTLYTLISGDVGTRGQYFKIYTYADRDRHTTPIHSHFWGHGDSSLGYIPTEIGTDTSPIYTLISGDTRTAP